MTEEIEYIATISRSSKREYDCVISSTDEIVTAVALREIIRKDHLVVGDRVKVRPIPNDTKYEIFEAIPRTSEVFRKIVRINKKKVIAANVDYAIIVNAVSRPAYKPNLIDRYLTRAIQWGVTPIVIFNKMDQFDNQFDLEFEKRKFTYLGIQTFELSNKNYDWESNLSELKKTLKNKVSIFLGQSGVGKSELINTLTDQEYELKTNRLAKKVEKGSHTTTWSEFYQHNDVALIDSPGIRSLAMNDLDMEDLDHAFSNIVELATNCQFRDCQHSEKSKGCYFHTLSDSEEDLFISKRLESYKRLKEEILSVPHWQKN